MSDLTFASYLQGPLGAAIRAQDDGGPLPPPAFAPAVTLTSTVAPPVQVTGPAMGLLGPGHAAGLPAGAVVRCDPPDGVADVEPNYLAAVELVPPDLPWLLTPARPAGGRLRPWLVLVVVDEVPVRPGDPLPTIEAPLDQLPDLRDSWGWAHVQRVRGTGLLPGGGQATAGTVARLLCPRRLSEGHRYRACLVPAFASGVAAGLGDPGADRVPHDLAWRIDGPTPVLLPVYHTWTFATGRSGDFEQLVTRLHPADPAQLRQASVRPIDIRAPWPGDRPLAPDSQLVGVQGALVPFGDVPPPVPTAGTETLDAFDTRIRAHLNARADQLAGAVPGDTVGAVTPPMYAARHVLQERVSGPSWFVELNTAVARRVAAGIGTQYVRDHQEDLMAKAWDQVGAIRSANRLRGIAELTTAVAEGVHRRHVATLAPGELLAFAVPADTRTTTGPEVTLAQETAMSRMAGGTGTTGFMRRLRPDGKLARRSRVSVGDLLPRALRGDVTIPGAAAVVPDTPTVTADGVAAVAAVAAADQLVAVATLARVARLNESADAGDHLDRRLAEVRLGPDALTAMQLGAPSRVAPAIVADLATVTTMTTQLLSDLVTDRAGFGTVDRLGVQISASALADRVVTALHPGRRHHARLDSMLELPGQVTAAGPDGPVMAYPVFPVPTALTLLDSDPEWFMPGLGAVATDTVALLRPNNAFVEAYLAGINQEMMAELLWREYPTDQRGTPFRQFWPRPDATADIPPLNEWTDDVPLGSHATFGDGLTVLLVRGDVVRRYPGMTVTAARSGPPDQAGRVRPDPTQDAVPPLFAIRIDDATVAYGFPLPSTEVDAWFFVFAEHGHRLRFGFDEPPGPGEAHDYTGWYDLTWPADEQNPGPGTVPQGRGHALAGTALDPPAAPGPDAPAWNRDAADIARIALQRPFRVAIQAAVLLGPGAPG
ncbi:hypothetical protein [Granulicoccus phenolivorans]|uniref:hypothetical protein n=1 Tax=Granulicoccus phenolivorans TaxID=266854 RepID=UPI000426CE9F|nr:hypothetical protein [Granulicoccus phenolivorans]